jgi:hypothetical protein
MLQFPCRADRCSNLYGRKKTIKPQAITSVRKEKLHAGKFFLLRIYSYSIIEEIKITSMNRLTVISSDIKSVGYELTEELLEIEFHSGGIYQYSNVPPAIHYGLMNAVSHGTYFNRYIKKSAYPFRKIM